MAGKEKKSTISRQLLKENAADKDNAVNAGDTPKRLRGRPGKLNVVNNIKKVVRKKKADPSTPIVTDDTKLTSPRSGKKAFLEKELEDLLENATGRNTPSIGARETDDDDASVRSLTTFLRNRRVPDDDVVSLRSVKIKKEDDDTSSVRSIPVRKVAKTTPPAVKTKSTPVKKKPGPKPQITKKTVDKAKQSKKKVKKPLRAMNKIVVTKRRSTMLIKKKVKNAQKAVKRIYRKKNILKEIAQLNESSIPVVETNGEVVVKTEKKEGVISSGKRKITVKKKELKAVEVKKRKKVVETPSPTVSDNGSAKKTARKRGWRNSIHYETQQSPDDASVIIVQPRLGPKVRKSASSTPVVSNGTPVVPPVLTPTTVPASASAPALPAPSPPTAPLPPQAVAVPAAVTPGPTSPGNAAPASTPYFIQSMPNFNALKSQPNNQGDWLVTPSGVVLIQAVPQGDRPSTRVENPEAMSTSLTPAVPSPVSGSAPAQSDSILSEKAKEAEHVTPVALPVIPVARNVDDLLLIKSQIDEVACASSNPVLEEKEEEPKKAVREFIPNPTVSSERRASHDGSFGSPTTSCKLRRVGSCDRLSNPNFDSCLLTNVESVPDELTHSGDQKELTEESSLSLPEPEVVSLENIAETAEIADPLPEAESVSIAEIADAIDETSDVDGSACDEPIESKDKAEKSSSLEEPSSETIDVIELPQLEESASSSQIEPMELTNGDILDSGDDNVVTVTAIPKIIPTTAEAPAKRCPKDDIRGLNRARKYSRSLDSRKKLLPGLRRRSHPEPRVINIVTSSDGSRQGLTLVDELRQQHAIDSSNVPYCVPSTSSQPPSPLTEKAHREGVSKETILSALGLRSLKEAEELAKKKKELQLQQQHQIQQQLATVNNIYTGTLKTVIKIQRPEKKGNGRMIYKASSATGAVGSEANSPEEDVATESSAKESHESGDDEGKNGNGKVKALVIPEKASSFSIHPHRLCSDVCTYCFGKFGLLDTPCHIAQLKDSDKRRNILSTETHLTLDSCLCDACFRHVDKKSNCPSFTEKRGISKRKLLPKKNTPSCCALGCDLEGKHNIRRKSILKLKKSLGKKLKLDEEKLNVLTHAHFVTLCNRHVYWVEYFMSCGMCKKRLNNIHMYRVGTEVAELNAILSADGIPAILTDKRFLCKICQGYASIRVKTKDSEMNASQKTFIDTCRKRILLGHGIVVPDSEGEVDHDDTSTKNGKQLKAKKKPTATVTNGVEDEPEVAAPPRTENAPKPETGNDDFSDMRAKFKPLPAAIDGVYKCSNTIQFTKTTKDLFYDLQRPYGSHSNFFRHLILLEKYFRSGDLVLSRNPELKAAKYINGVNNRLRSYEGTPTPKMSSTRPVTITPVPPASSTSSSTATFSSAPSLSPAVTATVPTQPPATSPLTQMQATVQSIGLKPEISITSVPAESRKLTPKIQENLRALANRPSPSKSGSSQTRAVILNRTVGGQKQSLVQVTTGGKTIHLTLAQFRRIQQMQLRKKQQHLELQKRGKTTSRTNGPSDESFPNIPKALSVSVTKVASVDLTKSSGGPD